MCPVINKFDICEFDICGSVHHHLINKTTNMMQLGAVVFIIPWKAVSSNITFKW
jgi:hypothetical protein